MNDVRIGVIGLGNMGSFHAKYLQEKRIRGAQLTAVSDQDPRRLAPFHDIGAFTSSEELIRSGLVDAVLIATPHYFHTTIGIDALEQGLHVLVEKPLSVHKADCLRLIEAHKDKKQVFAAMFNQRTDPHYVKLKRLLDTGELGEVQRVNWIVTDWFRTEAYYASGGWRATWRGEGGGVLLNQCPHQLDLLQWLFGMPVKVHAFCALGKYHQIEVEDEVTAFLTYANDATAVFITSTGEAPGTNRLEIVADRGRVVLEEGQIAFLRNEIPSREFLKRSPEPFAKPDIWRISIPVEGSGGQHQQVTQNFIDAILDGTPLIAPAEEGVRSVELANAMLYSSLTGSSVELPLDAQAYEKRLQTLMANSTYRKAVGDTQVTDITKSFG